MSKIHGLISAYLRASQYVLFTTHRSLQQTALALPEHHHIDDKLGWAYMTQEMEKKCVQSFSRKPLKRKDHLKKLAQI